MDRTQELAPAATPRFDTVDVLRGLSILAVVIHHTALFFLFSGYPVQKRVPPLLSHLLFWNGGNGVTVFFAVSGFLITLTSIRRFGGLAALRPRVFYRIRFARIAPLLTLIVGILTLFALLHLPGFTFGPKRPPLWRAILSAFTFHLNWLEARHGYLPGAWDVLWSLSVEEMFYLFFPLVCLFCFRFRRGLWLFLATLAAFIVMGPFARTVWTTNPIWQEKTYLGGTDAIALGCLTALLVDHLSRRNHGTWPLAHKPLLLTTQLLGVLLLTINSFGPRWWWRILPGTVDLYGTLLALAACLVILGSVLRHNSTTSNLPLSGLTASLRWYGRHSYEVYLTHEFLVVWVAQGFLRRHPNPGGKDLAPHQLSLPHMAAWFALILALTVPVAWAVARFFSEPLNRRLRGARPPR